ncbi:MAG: hypothetical protein ACHQK8_06185, partial [Bacteroidia bacterium]
MKTLRNLLPKFVMVISILISIPLVMINSCKKEVKSDKKISSSRGAASISDPTNYSEDEIGAFINDVVYYKANSGENKWLDATEAINKMEVATNYQYSDIDTPFKAVDTSFTYSFSLTANGDGQYNMPAIATKMYDIKNFILDKLQINLGSEYNTRVYNCSIDWNSNHDGYICTVYIIKTYKDWPAGIGSAIPTPPGVPNSYYHWAWDASICLNHCTLGAMYEIQKRGSEYMLAMQNYYIAQGIGLYWPTGMKPYYGGTFKMHKTGSNPTFFDYSDVPGTGTGSSPKFPTYTPDTIGDLIPDSTVAIFVGNIGTDVQSCYDAYSVLLDYAWCMPKALIDYYISKVPDIFNVCLGTQGIPGGTSAVPFIAYEDAQNPDNRNYSGFCVTHPDVSILTSRNKIFHWYQFKYTQLLFKT